MYRPSRPWLCAALLLSAVLAARAQFVSTLHETIAADSAQAITLEFAGDVEARNWPGNTVLVETDVRIRNISRGAFDYFIEEDPRYGIETAMSGGVLRIYSAVPERRPIETTQGVAEEQVKVRIHVPHRFAIDTSEGSGVYTRIYVPRASEGLRTGELAVRRAGEPAAPAVTDVADPAADPFADDPDIELLDASRLTDGVVISVDSSLVDFSTPGADTVRVDSASVRTQPRRR